ncbi:methionyl-tRNA formyltransferase [Novipirellula artificiosorum]|uniref:Methionyl-tRNA formyltransferase n=1 Tax=Novipirellula artificiosorum TaxID=2528016 RepID=A0A5C6D6X7_9BACT|nr:methionyl-tRNA formyltransferase [Novipirellula artificiosorum]TWU32578.1 Methionyl-tRNA formyltransferase [Novipirellula artificiosorum]
MPKDLSQPAESKLRMIMMGTGPFAIPSFDALRQAGHAIELVVTRPQPAMKSRKKTPPSPVRDWAAEHQFDLFDPASINDDAAIEHLRAVSADLLVVCDYGQILKPSALSTASLGGINLHGSLLPAYRGAAPVQRSMLSGDSVTGVSVIHMTPKLDGGPIIATRETMIADHETAGELEDRLSRMGVEATNEAVNQLIHWDRDSEIGVVQDPAFATRAPRLSKAEGEIDWSQTARLIDCHVRGMQPWPVGYTFVRVEGKDDPVRLAIKQVQMVGEVPSDVPPGTITIDGGLKIAAQDRWIQIVKLQPAGKREMAADEFLRGHHPIAIAH